MTLCAFGFEDIDQTQSPCDPTSIKQTLSNLAKDPK